MGYGLPKPRGKCIVPRASWYQGIETNGAINDLLREPGADGGFTMTGQETLKVLLETHFPDSKEVDSCLEE